MKTDLPITEQRESDLVPEIAKGMLRAIETNSRRILDAARKEWERKYAGSDPSDACVSVCIHSAVPRKIAQYSSPALFAREESLLASASH